MGATYTRQSTYAEGDTITAAHTNDEFDQLLAAFAASTGHTHDGTAGEGGPITKLLGTSITIGNATAGTDITVTFDGESNDGVLKWMEDEDYFEFSDDLLIASTEKIQFRDTGLYINSSTDGQLDIVADTEVQIAATTIDINGAVDVSGNLTVGGNLDVTGTFDLSDSNFTNAGDIQLDSISGDGDTNTSITFSGSDVITVTTGGSTAFTVNASQLITASAGITSTAAANTLGATSFNDANITNVGSIALDTITNDGTDITLDSSGDIILDADGGDVFVKDAGTTYGSLTNSSGNLVIKSGTTTALTFSGANATLAGDLTIGGDDLTMATNTSGALLIADGTNFNPTVVGDLSEISTVANDDVFLAVDTSGGGLKKIARSAIVSGLAAGTMSELVDDTSPQLGGNLDMNGADIVTTSNATLDLAPNGTGTVVVRGNTNSGAVVFNCESNSHGQKVYGQPHSAGVNNTLMLPAGADSTLVSLVSTDTLTNKTLTSPVINTGTFGTSILPVSADGTTLGSASKEFSDLFLADGAVISFGNDQEITLTHVADDGLILKHVGTGDGKEPSFSFHAGDNDIAANDVLGSIFFKAPDEGAGTDAILVAAGIEAVSEGNFSASNNATKLVFKTGASEAASEKMSLSSAGLLTVSGILKTDDATEATSTTDGSLQTDGGLSVVKDAVFGDDVKLLSDASVIHFGADSEVTLTHVADTGLALKHTATADDKPIVLTLQTGETDMAANDVIGKLAFQAPDEGTGTDAILVAAAVQAVAEGDFSSSNNATRLEFHTGASEAAAVKMTLNSTGSVKPVTYQETYASISAASTVDCDLLTANHFAVTLDQNTTFTFSNPPASGTSFAFTLIVTQHSTAVTLTWPNTVDWAGGSAPDAAGNNAVQAYGFITRDGGTTYYGFLGGTAIG